MCPPRKIRDVSALLGDSSIGSLVGTVGVTVELEKGISPDSSDIEMGLPA